MPSEYTSISHSRKSFNSLKKQEKEFRSTSRTGAIKLVPIHPFPLRQERIKEEFQNLFIQLEKGIRWGRARTEIKKFKVCSFKLKINHDKTELGALKKKKRSYLRPEEHLVFGGKGGGEQTIRPGAIFSPLHQVPKTKADSVSASGIYNLELQLSNNSDATTADLREGRQTTKKRNQ